MNLENIKKKIEGIGSHAWYLMGLIMFILALTIIIWVFFLKQPFLFILLWTGFIIAVPNLWERYSGKIVFNFWKRFFLRLFKSFLCLFIFLLIRGYFAHVIDFSIFETYVSYMSKGMPLFFGYPTSKILFESVFLLIVGLTVIEAVFGQRKQGKTLNAACYLIGAFFIGCFVLQTAFFALGYKGEVAQKAADPLREVEMVKAVGNNGFVGGPAKQLWRAAFGPGQETEGATKKINFPQPPNAIRAKIGIEKIILGPGEQVSREIPDGVNWHLYAPENGVEGVDWEFITQGMKYYDKEPGTRGGIDTIYPNQKMAFVIKTSKLLDKNLEFKLEIKG